MNDQRSNQVGDVFLLLFGAKFGANWNGFFFIISSLIHTEQKQKIFDLFHIITAVNEHLNDCHMQPLLL